MHHPYLVNYVMNPQEMVDGIQSEFHHGTLIRSLPRGYLNIGLYIDEVVLGDGLSKASSHNKVSFFYGLLCDIPNELRSKGIGIFPLALSMTSYLDVEDIGQRKCRYDTFFSQFNSSSLMLQNNAVNFHATLPALRTRSIVLLGDMLSLFGVSGMAKCFNNKSRSLCLRCYLITGRIPDITSLADCLEWTADRSFDSFCKYVSPLSPIGLDPVLDYCYDPMHILLEGLIPKEFRLFLKHCYKHRDVTKVLLKRFLGEIKMSKGHSLPYVNKDGKLKGNSSQFLDLVSVLPNLLEKFPSICTRRRDCLLLLGEITELVFSHSVDAADLARLVDIIKQHHIAFKTLYGHVKKAWKPKHHYLQHLPELILRYGSGRCISCMRLESLHHSVKRKEYCNHQNLTLSAATQITMRLLASSSIL
jgi:hypothetical protein